MAAMLCAIICKLGATAWHNDFAFEWLREQEAEADKTRRWTLYAAVIAAAVAVITLLATLGVIK